MVDMMLVVSICGAAVAVTLHSLQPCPHLHPIVVCQLQSPTPLQVMFEHLPISSTMPTLPV